MDNTEREFFNLVNHGKKAYRSKKLEIKEFLKKRIKNKKLEFKHLKPNITVGKWKCLTCGNKDKSHPNTSFCFKCDTDNWEEIDI